MQLPQNTPLDLPVFLFDGEKVFLKITLRMTDTGLRNSTLADIATILKKGDFSKEARGWEAFLTTRRWVTGIMSSQQDLVLPDHYVRVTSEGAEEIKPS